MLKSIDRIQVAVPNADEAARGWVDLLGAEFDSRGKVRALAATRAAYRIGRGFVEFLEPDGSGRIDAALKKRGRAHLFAGGISTDDHAGEIAKLRQRGIEVSVEGGQAFLNAKPAPGVDAPLVLSAHEDRPSVGHIDFLYEVTLLAQNPQGVASSFAEMFGLNERNFVPIASDKFAYNGVLTLFSPDDLHRFEVICPTTDQTTMGRYFARQGDSYYMCFAESAGLLDIERRVNERGAGITVDRPAGRGKDGMADQMWVHPRALGGVMLGLSRPSMAWTWSGHPERVRAIA
jgi:hypothetical protein